MYGQQNIKLMGGFEKTSSGQHHWRSKYLTCS